MARKSRKNIPEVVSSATVQTEVSRPFRAGLYARISMEKEEKSAQNGEKSESYLHTFHFCVKIGRAKITEKK